MNEAVMLKDKIAAHKKAKVNGDELKAVQDTLAATEKAMREVQAKADAIDAAVYDLKAVNPRVRVERDTRTVPEMLDSIASHNQVMCQALERLRSLA